MGAVIVRESILLDGRRTRRRASNVWRLLVVRASASTKHLLAETIPMAEGHESGRAPSLARIGNLWET